MTDFKEITEEWNKIKDTPEVIDENRVTKNTVGGTAADDTAKRQRFLPSEEEHAKNSDRLATMFDKSSRAGAKSTLNGLILPNGRKNFADFHDNYTGTGRMDKKPDRQMAIAPGGGDAGKRVDTKTPSVVLYERCMDCMKPVSKDDCVPNMVFIPTGEKIAPQELAKWKAVGLKPGDIVCYLFCTKCPEATTLEFKKLKNDPITSLILVPGPDSKPMTLADKQSQSYLHQRSRRISDQVIATIKLERNNKDSDCFYGEARLAN